MNSRPARIKQITPITKQTTAASENPEATSKSVFVFLFWNLTAKSVKKTTKNKHTKPQEVMKIAVSILSPRL